MTLLVVHQNKVYIDRRTVIGDADDTACKIIKVGDAVYASAGSGGAAQLAMFELHQSGDWFGVVKTAKNDPDGTYIVARIADRLYTLDLACEEPRFSPALPPNNSGLQHMAGSGWKFFHAYYREHEDIDVAFRLTGKYCRDVTPEYDVF